MRTWLLKRILLLLFVLWGVTTIVFIILNAVPRNPAIAMAGSWATAEQVEKFTKRWGLDRPIIERYFRFYYFLFQGDLGTSIRTERPVLAEIVHYFPATFELATFSIMLSLLIGIPLGTVAATKRNKLIDQITRFMSLIGVATPNFWLGLLLLLLFYKVIGWVGPGRISSSAFAPKVITNLYLLDSLVTWNWPALLDSLKHLILPSFALSFFGIGIITRMLRSAMLDIIHKDYVVAARAKGLSLWIVIYRHALKNAMIPVITVVGVLYGAYLGGAVIIEVVYAWPGLGSLAYRSILKADQPVIMGVTLVIALLYSLVNLLVDVVYRLLDPRIRFGADT